MRFLAIVALVAMSLSYYDDAALAQAQGCMTFNDNGQTIIQCPDAQPVVVKPEPSIAERALPLVLGGGAALLVLVVALSNIRLGLEWNRYIVFRLGRFDRVAGPGLFAKCPFIERVQEVVDMRVRGWKVKAEEALTKDTVPVDVEAIIFWRVEDAKLAVLETDDYETNTEEAAAGALREALGAHTFAELLSAQQKLDDYIATEVQKIVAAWGGKVTGVEIKGVKVPEGLQDSMSREAQAQREGHAREQLARSELAIAATFKEAAKIYESDPVSLELRKANLLYEMNKDRGATILLPTDLVDALARRATRNG